MLLHAALIGNSTRFTRQDGVEEQWRIMQPLLDNPPRSTPTPRARGARPRADQLVAGHSGWHGPWLES